MVKTVFMGIFSDHNTDFKRLREKGKPQASVTFVTILRQNLINRMVRRYELAYRSGRFCPDGQYREMVS